MALYGANAGYYEDTRRDPIVTLQPEPVNTGSLLALLDERFSIFKELVIRANFRNLLNDLRQRHTIFAFPDKYLTDDNKSALLELDVTESLALIGSHIIRGVNKMSYLTDNKFLIPTMNPYSMLFVDAQNMTVGLNQQTFQKSQVLNDGDMSTNGVIVVIKDPLIPQTNYV